VEAFGILERTHLLSCAHPAQLPSLEFWKLLIFCHMCILHNYNFCFDCNVSIKI
jgi:hypothetical protein